MAVGLGGVKHGLYQPGVVPVFRWTIHILRMCPLRDCCSGNGACSVTLPGYCWVLERTIPICKMFPHVPGVVEISVVSYLIHQHCLKVSGCYFVDLGSTSVGLANPPGQRSQGQEQTPSDKQTMLMVHSKPWILGLWFDNTPSLSLWLVLQDHMCLSHMAWSTDPL